MLKKLKELGLLLLGILFVCVSSKLFYIVCILHGKDREAFSGGVILTVACILISINILALYKNIYFRRLPQFKTVEELESYKKRLGIKVVQGWACHDGYKLTDVSCRHCGRELELELQQSYYDSKTGQKCEEWLKVCPIHAPYSS